MSIESRLQNIKKLSNSSLTSIIDVTNLNFKNLSEANLDFLSNINYNETSNSFSVNRGTFTYVDVTDTLFMKLDGITTFKIDSLGRAEGQEILVVVSEAKRRRFTDFNDWPDVGVPGEVIYTGIQNNKPEFGEDFIGYLDGRGWVSLTTLSSPIRDLTLYKRTGSPFTYPSPPSGTGILWIGTPGLENKYEPDEVTTYFTDDNGNTFDILTNHIWKLEGNDASFKPTGKAIIGSTENPGAFQFIDGNQQSGWVLTSDGQGNATWAEPTGGTGGVPNFAYWEIRNFTADVTETITHDLDTTNIVVDFIDTVINKRTEGHADNYTSNTIDVTLPKTKNSIKVIILAAGGADSDDIQKFSREDKNMVAIATITIGSPGTPALATNDIISETPVDGSYIEAKVNGVEYEVGDGVKNKSFYFSGDNGITARNFSSGGPNGKVQAGDELYWNGNDAGFELENGWRISLLYLV